MSGLIYTFISMLSIYMFGTNLKTDILDNIAVIDGWVSTFLRTIFLFVLACHIPYIFFSGKDSVINLYLEIKNRKISEYLRKTRVSFTLDQLASMTSNLEHFIITVSVLAVEVIGGIFITDIDIIFSFVTALGFSLFCFTFPGAFYI